MISLKLREAILGELGLDDFEFTEATTDIYLNALFEIGLVLFVITLIINSASRLLIWSMARSGSRSAESAAAPAEVSA